MDDAMLTRMLHFTLNFEVKAWAKWATAAGVDPRGIAFVLNYPETVTGKRTTPRTLAHFFEQIEGIKDLKAGIELVATLAASSLDETTVAAFVSFVNDDLSALLHPEDILNAAHGVNFAEFMLQEAIPNDLRGSLMMDLSNHPSPGAKGMLKDKRLAKLLLEKL